MIGWRRLRQRCAGDAAALWTLTWGAIASTITDSRKQKDARFELDRPSGVFPMTLSPYGAVMESIILQTWQVSNSRKGPAYSKARPFLLSGGGLVISTESASGKSKRLALRYQLQNAARALLPGWRLESCGRQIAPGRAGVDVLFDPEHGAAHFGGLMACGSVWVCPVCAARIMERRRLELAGALADHPELTPVMVTVTLQHDRGDALGDLMGALKDGLRFVRAGRGWQDLAQRLGLVGSVTATEITHGNASGWHPHLHVLLLFTSAPSEADIAAVQAFVADKFGAYLARVGRWSSPIYGVQAQRADAGAGSYLAKWGAPEELTKANAKTGKAGGLSPWGLLLAYSGGNEHAGALFLDYADATKGRRVLSYSKGLRALLGLESEQTDAEIAAAESAPGAVILASLTPYQWRRVLANDARAELLTVASAGDVAALWAWLAQFWEDG